MSDCTGFLKRSGAGTFRFARDNVIAVNRAANGVVALDVVLGASDFLVVSSHLLQYPSSSGNVCSVSPNSSHLTPSGRFNSLQSLQIPSGVSSGGSRGSRYLPIPHAQELEEVLFPKLLNAP